MKLITPLSFLSIMSYGICLTIIGPALSKIQATFMVSEGQLGLLITALSAGIMISVLSGGYIVDRYGIKSVALSGQIFLTAGLFLFSMTDIFSIGLTSFFLIGIGGGLIEIATNTVISGLYGDRRVSWMNILHAFVGIGALTGPFLSGYILNQGLEWQVIYRITALFSTLVSVLILFIRFPGVVESEKVDFSYLKGLIRDPVMLLIGLMMLLYVGSEMGITYWSVIYMERYLSIDNLIASSFLSYFWVALTTGRFICFVVARRVGGKFLLFVLSLGSLISYAFFMMINIEWVSGLSLTITGLFFSGIFPTILALGVNRFPHALGTTNGFMLSFMGLGLLFFPYQMGVVTLVSSMTSGMFMVILTILLLWISSATLMGSRQDL